MIAELFASLDNICKEINSISMNRVIKEINKFPKETITDILNSYEEERLVRTTFPYKGALVNGVIFPTTETIYLIPISTISQAIIEIEEDDDDNDVEEMDLETESSSDDIEFDPGELADEE